MAVGECLHGVGSFKQSIFPQNIAVAASWDTDLAYRIARAIGKEARSIGIHGCFSPVLDLALDPRWGRVQEGFGEDKVLTSHMGVAYSSGLSKNGSWHDDDAVFPIMKHFAAHGSPQAGRNAAPFTGQGTRQIKTDMLTPFKASYDLGGARGIMMSYNEIDGIPAAVHPMLYEALHDWEFDGIVIADDLCMKNLITQHQVASCQADAMAQWFNAGGMIDFYDWGLDSYINTTKALVLSNKLSIETLRSHVRRILKLKKDVGLFAEPYIPAHIDPLSIVESHRGLALEAAAKSIVLLKNEANVLPLNLKKRNVALVGPFVDTLNFGGYSGVLGQEPAQLATTLRQGMLKNLFEENEKGSSTVFVRSAWGANSWNYENQYAIPPYLLSYSGVPGGLMASYFEDKDFKLQRASRQEIPALDWGLYPPDGLPSNNFSAIWEGQLESPVDTEILGTIGVATGSDSTMRLFVDDKLLSSHDSAAESDLLPNILPYEFTQANGTQPPPNGIHFVFKPGVKYRIRIEYQTMKKHKLVANQGSVNSQILLWWNLVSRDEDPVSQAVTVARDADVIVLALGSAWNSDGENSDNSMLKLSTEQDRLANAIFELGKPVVLSLSGGRPFAIPHLYAQATAVLLTFYGGQAGGQAVADILTGRFSPGGRLPLSIPRHAGQLPIFYNMKPSSKLANYNDDLSEASYPFGYGLSYSNFSLLSFSIAQSHDGNQHRLIGLFSEGEELSFSVTIANTGSMAGSYVVQIYLLGRVSQVTQPVRQLMAFKRVYVAAKQNATVTVQVDVDRYLKILNRQGEWELEKGNYTFSILEHSGIDGTTGQNLTLQCV
ncbi:glycoside hydrolase family 3 protein [Akanthomyces lecanii RCEF 1005]|uniref:xylan 1,4-beta-xylosidase n=1 Tax=Akanthomyces lecanii RCEF 1005 TaxID=1081108 RepID=A0A162KHM2_CORDF|nr:glycoside hydrolase family 3 protein [Akanthomyces lecanii RCEF 1005]